MCRTEEELLNALWNDLAAAWYNYFGAVGTAAAGRIGPRQKSFILGRISAGFELQQPLYDTARAAVQAQKASYACRRLMHLLVSQVPRAAEHSVLDELADSARASVGMRTIHEIEGHIKAWVPGYRLIRAQAGAVISAGHRPTT
jgi:hypothetical protein